MDEMSEPTELDRKAARDALQAWLKSGRFTRGGFPSGTSYIAAAIAVAREEGRREQLKRYYSDEDMPQLR
jgi:hypothetical protein